MKPLHMTLMATALCLPLSALAQVLGTIPAEQPAEQPAMPAPATNAPLLAAEAVPAPAPEVPAQVAALQEEWAIIKYKTANTQEQEARINTLVEQARQVSLALDDMPEAVIWEAIILSTRAGIVGGTSALDDIRAAKDLLEQVIATQPDALHGSAYTSLGSLYYKAPGWPLSFGDNAKAEANLKQALAINPDGIDPNFFYGEFLHEQGRDAEAKIVLEHALAAAPRPGREIADAGRRDEISTLLAQMGGAS